MQDENSKLKNGLSGGLASLMLVKTE